MRILTGLLACALVLGGAAAQAAGGATDARDAGPTGSSATADGPRVVGILGASVSAGFIDPRPLADGSRNETVRIRRVLDVVWSGPDVRLADYSDVATFMNPSKRQTPRIARLKRKEPDLIVAVDFMFWFGYGGRGRADSLARQQQGFALLESFSCPILLGDYPDMTGADPNMIPEWMIPELATQKELNDRLVAWIEERDHVTHLPLAAFVAQAKAEGERLELAGGARHASPEVLLQGDRLHASRLGMAVLGSRVVGLVRGMLADDDPLRPTDDVTLDALVVAAGAEFVLEDLPKIEADAPGAGRDRKRDAVSPRRRTRQPTPERPRARREAARADGAARRSGG